MSIVLVVLIGLVRLDIDLALVSEKSLGIT